MIRFRDAGTLALTKLRTRKVRLIVTVVISGLLFTGLAGASMVTRGAFGSIESFSDEGFGKRFIVSGISEQVFGYHNDQSVIARAKQLHQQTLDRKVAEAKRLRLQFDPKTEPLPVHEFDTPEGTQQSLDFTHPAALEAISEYLAARPATDLPEMKALADGYGAREYYESRNVPQPMDGTSLAVLKEGKESYGQSREQFGPPTGIDSFTGFWQAASGELLEPFILPGQSLALKDGDLPIIVPFSAAEELLGLQALPSSSPTGEKLERTKQVRAAADTIRFEICVRNGTSSGLVNQAVSTQQEIELNKDNRDYRRPSLMYGLPEEACGAVPVVRDVRTAGEKQLAARQEEFDRIFGKQPAQQQKVGFRVVGVVPDMDFGAASTVGQIIRTLVTSSLGSGWYTPLELVREDPTLKGLFEGGASLFGMPPSYYAEFTSPGEARTFLDQASCNPDFSGGADGKSTDPYEKCREEGRPFMLSAFGSNSLALDSAKRGFGKIFRIAALVIALIAAIIMMGTVGRMIADSRRETAVFRAIGAKKLDIAQIYLLYTIMLSVLICAFALLLGGLLAGIVHTRFADEVTVEALVAYNAQDLNRTFSLYGLYWPDMLQLIGLALAGGLVSAVLPLLRNLRRNPIRDMRDDT